MGLYLLSAGASPEFSFSETCLSVIDFAEFGSLTGIIDCESTPFSVKRLLILLINDDLFLCG
jgi:hypothetical protein